MASLEPVERHGEEPVLLECRDRTEEIDLIGGMIKAFEASGHASLGIIAKTNRDARALYDSLKQSMKFTFCPLKAAASPAGCPLPPSRCQRAWNLTR